MADIIQLLPDSVANQIAAGEVIQRPASIVKEMVENAVDAGSTSITVNIKDGGKTLVQVIDNGCGMSETDARMSFERHATSKIQSAQDLFAIRTMGFRGEALASIASVAEVEMKTKRMGDETGTLLKVNGYEFELQEPTACNNGTYISVKNLFYNIPARRKFLKADATEFRNIVLEFQRICIAYPDIEFTLYHNNNEIYNLPKTNLKQRIVHVFGKNISQNLTTLDTKTIMANITGYIGKPENAKKKYGEQYFFVNNRFMKHPYFHRAVMDAYQQILPPDAIPSYFIFFEVPPESIDINIHPTKTEIKFEDEQALWQIIKAAVRESLGKFNIIPSLDFETAGIIDIPVKNKNTEINIPGINVNSSYNPFEYEDKEKGSGPSSFNPPKQDTENWESLFENFKNSTPQDDDEIEETLQQQSLNIHENTEDQIKFMQFKNKYVLSAVKSGLMIIDQRRAHERILFENFLIKMTNHTATSQSTMFPEEVELSGEYYQAFEEIKDELRHMGFMFEEKREKTVTITGHPSDLETNSPGAILEKLIEEYNQTQSELLSGIKDKTAASMAKISAIGYNKILNLDEMRELVDKLFACTNPNFSPGGKPIINIINMDDLEKNFK